MKKFFIKIAIFIFILFFVGRIISYLIPYHWGNPWFSSKIQFLKKLDLSDRPNTYFFGSSRVYRQINPKVFDSIYNTLTTSKIKSFNLGAPATFCPQTYFLYEHFLNSSLSQKTKFVFIELMDIDRIEKSLLHQERTTYWQNLSDLNFIFRSVFSNPLINPKLKFLYFKNYTISYIENIFHLGHFGQQLVTQNYYQETYVGPYRNGFFPLEYDLINTNNESLKQSLIKRKESLIKEPKKLQKRSETSIEQSANLLEPSDDVHIARIMQLLELSENHNIHLIFLRSPRNSTQNISNLYSYIPIENRLDLSNAAVYPEFYSLENSFDVGHLNLRGSKLYSEILAKRFFDLLDISDKKSSFHRRNKIKE